MDISTSIILISSTAAAVVSIVNAVAAGWGRKATQDARADLVERAVNTDTKLNQIHETTNGTLTKATDRLETANDRILELQRQIQSLQTMLGASTPSQTKDPS